jgi:nucleoid-associated protein
MRVNHLIIHNLKKEQQQKAELIISREALDPGDSKAVSLIEELNARYKNNIVHGVFSAQSGESDNFQKEFDGYLKNKKPPANKRFFEMSQKTINLLYSRIDSIQAAKGGYILFADYQPRDGLRYFSVFLIRDITGKVFELNKNTIIVEEIIHADTANLAMACRINVEKYQSFLPEGGGTYLGFISVKQSETSGYFIDWIGAERRKKNAEDSQNLVAIITKMDPPADEDGKPVSREEFHRQAHDAIKAFGKREVNVNSLSMTIFGDESKIMEYAEQNGIEMSTEFFPNERILRRLIVHSAKGDNIDLRYPPSSFNKKIRIDKTNPNIIIIDSEALANAIRREEKTE